MKNIKNILTIISLLAAPVAFGCGDGDSYNSMNSDYGYNTYNSTNSDYGYNTSHSPMSMSGPSLSGMRDSGRMNQSRPWVAPAQRADVDRPGMRSMNAEDRSEAIDADYSYDNDEAFGPTSSNAVGYGSGASYSGY